MKLRALALGLLCAAFFTGHALAQDWAKERLNKSPRHSEWVDLKHGDRTVKTFVVYPEVKTKAPAGACDPRNFWPDGLGKEPGR